MLKKSFVYLFGEIVSKISPFILLPLITNHFSPTDFSLYSNYLLISNIFQIVLSTWIVTYLTISYFKSRLRYRLIVNLTRIYLLCLMFIVIFTYLVSMYISINNSIYVFILSAISGVFLSFTVLYLSTLQIKGNAIGYVIFSVLKSFLILFFSYCYIIYNDREDIYFIIEINILINALFSIYVYFLTKEKIRVNKFIYLRMLKKSAIYGWPLIPGILMNYARTSFDRFLIVIYFSSMIMGIYTAVYQLSSAILIVSMSIIRGLTPSLMIAMKDNNIHVIRKYTIFYVAIVICTSVTVGIFIYFFSAYFLGDDFSNAKYFYPLALFFMFQSISSFFTCYYQFYEKTKLLMKINILCLSVYCFLSTLGASFSLNMFLCAMVISSFFSMIISYYNGYKNVIKNS